jgi:serine O-acetyltransferase
MSAAATPSILALAAYRVAHMLNTRGWPRAAWFVALLDHLWHKASISPRSCLLGGAYLPHPVGVIFHGRAGAGLTLYAHSACLSGAPLFAGAAEEGPSLGDGVSLGAHAVVIGSIVVGSGCRLAARTVLTRDAPAGRLVASAGGIRSLGSRSA